MLFASKLVKCVIDSVLIWTGHQVKETDRRFWLTTSFTFNLNQKFRILTLNYNGSFIDCQIYLVDV